MRVQSFTKTNSLELVCAICLCQIEKHARCPGKWANDVSHPSGGITKEYVVTTTEYPNRQQLKGIADGCLVDGSQVQPISVQIEASDPHLRNKLRIVLAEGKNREVRVSVHKSSHTCQPAKST